MHTSSSFTEDFATPSPIALPTLPAEIATDSCASLAAPLDVERSMSDVGCFPEGSTSHPHFIPSPSAPGFQHWALGVGRSALGVAAGPERVEGAASAPSSIPSAPSPNSPCPPATDTSHEFPAQTLPPVLGFITRELSRASSTPIPLATSITLALASAAIGQGASFRDGERHICPNLYFLLLTESSPERDLLYKLALEPLANAQEKAEHEAIHRTRVDRRAQQLRLHAQRADLQTMNTTRRAKQARADQYDDRHFDPEVSRLPFDSRLQAQRETAHFAAEAHFSNDLRDLARAEEEFDRQSAGDQSHYFSHIPRGRLLRRLLTHPSAFAYLNLDARHAASVFKNRLSSAAASDESALLAAHTRTPISCEPKIHGHGFAAAPCATVLWSMPMSEWQSLRPDPNTPLIPRFLILNTPSSCDEADSLSCSCSCSQTGPAAATALDCGSPLPPCGVSQPAASGVAGFTEITNHPDSLPPVACGTCTSTCTCLPAALSDWADTISQLLKWKSAFTPREYPLSVEARALFHAYDRECRQKSRQSVSRPHDPDHARRLALLFHTIQDAAETAIPAPADAASASASHSRSQCAPEACTSHVSRCQSGPDLTSHDESAPVACGTCTCTCTPLPISAAMAAAAITLTRWFAQHQHPILHPELSDADPLLDRILDQLHRCGGRAPIGRFANKLEVPHQKVRDLVDCYPHLLRLDHSKPGASGPKTQHLILLSKPSDQTDQSDQSPPISETRPSRGATTWDGFSTRPGERNEAVGATSIHSDQSDQSPQSEIAHSHSSYSSHSSHSSHPASAKSPAPVRPSDQSDQSDQSPPQSLTERIRARIQLLRAQQISAPSPNEAPC